MVIQRVFDRDRKKRKKNSGWLLVEKDGTIRKANPEEAPKRHSLLDGEGCSSEDGTPCFPNLDGQVRKRAKTKI